MCLKCLLLSYVLILAVKERGASGKLIKSMTIRARAFFGFRMLPSSDSSAAAASSKERRTAGGLNRAKRDGASSRIVSRLAEACAGICALAAYSKDLNASGKDSLTLSRY